MGSPEKEGPVEGPAAREPSEALGVPVPEPSFAPLVLALGALALAFGLIFRGLVLALGLGILLAGVGLWLYEDIKRFPKA